MNPAEFRKHLGLEVAPFATYAEVAVITVYKWESSGITPKRWDVYRDRVLKALSERIEELRIGA